METHHIASVLVRLPGGISATLMANRATWGRKGRIPFQIFGATGTMLFDQKRANKFQIYSAADPAETAGFPSVLARTQHRPYRRFVPALGHGLGFNAHKVVEARELIAAIAGQPAGGIDFVTGLRVENAVDAMTRSHHAGGWWRSAERSSRRCATPAFHGVRPSL